MNFKKLHLFLLITVILLGTVLRFYKLGDIPNVLNWDEVSWGYNAYSILETGKDEHGESFPLSFKAFGDYKQPVYVYSQVLPIKVFGLNAFAVRFPNALLGSVSILFVYLLVYELFASLKYRKSLALLAAFFYAVSPWSIQFSRVAFEANMGLVFVITGAWLFIRGLNTKNMWYLFSACIPLGISAYTYHSEKLFTPLFFGGLLLLGYKFFIKNKKLAVFVILFFILCNIFWLADTRTTARGRSVTFTSQQTQILERSTERIEHERVRGDKIGELSQNRRFVYATKYVDNYLKHFDLKYLFMEGDNARHHAPGMGVLYLVNLPFIAYGIFSVIRRKIPRAWFVFFWLLLAPAASALAVDAPNASRSMIILPTWQIFAAFGWYFVFEKLKNVKFERLWKVVLIVLFIGNFYYFVHQYFTLTNYAAEPYWQYGYKEAVEFANNVPSDKKVIFAKDVEQPYVFYLFHNSYSPEKYLSGGGSVRISEKCFNIENAYFGECLDKVEAGDYVITTFVDQEIDGTEIVETISYTNGDPALVIREAQ